MSLFISIFMPLRHLFPSLLVYSSSPLPSAHIPKWKQCLFTSAVMETLRLALHQLFEDWHLLPLPVSRSAHHVCPSLNSVFRQTLPFLINVFHPPPFCKADLLRFPETWQSSSRATEDFIQLCSQVDYFLRQVQWPLNGQSLPIM